MLLSPCHTAHLVRVGAGRVACAVCDLTYEPTASELTLAALSGVPFEQSRTALFLIKPRAEVQEAS
ncbi:MAG: hypothetical protein ACRDP8_16440 [Actinopolymorphaceae bacterium]